MPGVGQKVRTAVIGVGNCASSLVQGVRHYPDAKPGDTIPGLMHVELGGYPVRDIEFSAALFIKTPPGQYDDDRPRQMTEKFIAAWTGD